MAPVEVKVPDIGDFEDVPVIELLVERGQSVEAEDPLVTLESDKASMDVPSPQAGVVAELKVAVGDTVSEGDVVVTLEPPEGGAEEDEPEAEPETEAEPADPEPERDDDDEGVLPDHDEIYASPAVRRHARQERIDLSTIKGSGRGGRIVMEDLDRPAAPERAAPASGDSERVELSRIKKISGPRLTEWWQSIPHVTQHDEADITDLEAFRKQVNGEQDVKVTMVALLMKAVVASLKAHPEVNASRDGDDHLLLKRYYHLGFAADTPQGLLVPVVREVDQKGLLEVAAELRELSLRARDGKLKSDEMQDGTFTISSLGGIGGTFFTPIINGPQVAILGVSRSETKPVWDGEQFIPRLIVPLSFSYDHRVVDGALAARFTTHLSAVLGDLRRVLL